MLNDFFALTLLGMVYFFVIFEGPLQMASSNCLVMDENLMPCQQELNI